MAAAMNATVSVHDLWLPVAVVELSRSAVRQWSVVIYLRIAVILSI